MIDYMLTVAVSVAAGMAAVTSAIPSLSPSIVPIGVSVIGLLLAGNLRGSCSRRGWPGRRRRARVPPDANTGVEGQRGDRLAAGLAGESPEEIRHLTVVPVASLNLASVRALAYAASLRQPVLALHISPNAEEAERFRGYWSAWGDHLPLEVVISPYRAVVAPMPEIVVRHWWHRTLHDHLAPRLRRALKPLPKIVVTTIPFHLPASPSARAHRDPA